MADAGWRIADGKCRMADRRWQMPDGGWQMPRQKGPPTFTGCQKVGRPFRSPARLLGRDVCVSDCFFRRLSMSLDTHDARKFIMHHSTH